MKFSLSALLLAAAFVPGIATAATYILPETGKRPFSQVQPEKGGDTICSTWSTGRLCVLNAGVTYRLITYDANWRNGRTSFFRIPRTPATQTPTCN